MRGSSPSRNLKKGTGPDSVSHTHLGGGLPRTNHRAQYVAAPSPTFGEWFVLGVMLSGIATAAVWLGLLIGGAAWGLARRVLNV